MKVVRNKLSGRLVYRQIPDFETGKGILNVVIQGLYVADDLEEVEVADAEWEAELALREQERPRTAMEILEANLDTTSAQRDAFKLSELAGLTPEQVDTYIENNITTLATAKEFLKKLARVILLILKQLRFEE